VSKQKCGKQAFMIKIGITSGTQWCQKPEFKKSCTSCLHLTCSSIPIL